MNNMKNESQTKEKDLKKKTDQKSPQILKDQEKKKLVNTKVSRLLKTSRLNSKKLKISY